MYQGRSRVGVMKRVHEDDDDEINEEKKLFKRGLWTEEEDNILRKYISVNGKGKWNQICKLTGLKRCGKSCRLRWINYLSPKVKKDDFSQQEEDLIIRLHKLLGNRWSLIAGRIPGRTDNQVKNHWNTHLRKKLGIQKGTKQKTSSIPMLKSSKDQCSSSSTAKGKEIITLNHASDQSNSNLPIYDESYEIVNRSMMEDWTGFNWREFGTESSTTREPEQIMSEYCFKNSSFWFMNEYSDLSNNVGTLSPVELLDWYPFDVLWNGL